MNMSITESFNSPTLKETACHKTLQCTISFFLLAQISEY